MRRKTCLVLSMLLFISYVNGQDESDPLRYDAADAKRISYGDSTWITRKDNAPGGELIYSAASLGKSFTGFRVLCGWLRDQDLKNHFAFYYQESVQGEWIELTGFSWDTRTYPSPWYQVSYAYGSFPQGNPVSGFKVGLKATSYYKDDWNLGYNTLVGRVVLFTAESEELGIDEEKQYAISNSDGGYWIEQDGYIVLTETKPIYNGDGAWRFRKNLDLTYTVGYADNSVIFSFDSQLGFNDNQKNGLLLRYGNQYRYSHSEGGIQVGSDDRFLIDRKEDGKYTLRRAHDGRAVGMSEVLSASSQRVSVTRGQAEEFILTEISNPNNVCDQQIGEICIVSLERKLEVTGLDRGSLVQVYFISGRQVIQIKVENTGFACALEPGIYLVNVLAGNTVVRKKIIIK